MDRIRATPKDHGVLHKSLGDQEHHSRELQEERVRLLHVDPSESEVERRKSEEQSRINGVPI